MEMKTDLAALLEKYQNVMKKFAYQGKEPAEKERLRYLLRNQHTSVGSLSPEPEDWNAWTEACIRKADWSGLCRVMNQRSKIAMMPVIYGGYNYEKNVHCMLECLACGNIQAVERILPPALAQVKNCYDPFFPAAAHVLIGLWYKDDAVLEWAVPDAERFLEQKKTKLFEKGMVAFLLDLVRGDINKASEDLLAVCKDYPREKRPALGVRPFCTFAHGLYCLAQLVLPGDAFRTIKMPEDKNFLSDFALWRQEHPDPDLSLWFRWPEDLALLNEICEAPPARLALEQPFLNTSYGKPREREYWMADGVKWVDNYVDELWDMGIGNSKSEADNL